MDLKRSGPYQARGSSNNRILEKKKETQAVRGPGGAWRTTRVMTGHWTVASFFEKFSSPCWQHPSLLLLLAASGIFLSVSYTKLLVFSFIRPSSVKSLLSAKVFPLLVFKGRPRFFSRGAHRGLFQQSGSSVGKTDAQRV